MKNLLITILAILLILFAGLGVTQLVKSDNKIKLKEIQLKDSSTKLKILDDQYNELLKNKEVDQKKLEELQKQKEELEKQLTVKKSNVVYASGDNDSIMRQAGISDLYYANLIIKKESSWQVGVINSIGCVGLIQACPEGLKPEMDRLCPNWQNDAVCQLKVAEKYMQVRYGSWANAWNFHIINNYW
jgi:hypothetical protein